MQPCIFLNHGGGPLPLMLKDDAVRSHLLTFGSRFKQEYEKPKSILVISAHYESASSILVTSSSKPDMYFDYYGCPPDTYKYKYPAPGNPELASRIHTLLKNNKIPCELDTKRGFDHGVFIPLMLTFPDADIPVVTLSLHASFNPELHLRIGESLQALREEGVLIIGSGMSFHSKGGTEKNPAGKDFDQALCKLMANPDSKYRNEMLSKWEQLPGARNAHPREEHLIPLHVVVGAAGSDVGRNDSFVWMRTMLSTFTFS